MPIIGRRDSEPIMEDQIVADLVSDLRDKNHKREERRFSAPSTRQRETHGNVSSAGDVSDDEDSDWLRDVLRETYHDIDDPAQKRDQRPKLIEEAAAKQGL